MRFFYFHYYRMKIIYINFFQIKKINKLFKIIQLYITRDNFFIFILDKNYILENLINLRIKKSDKICLSFVFFFFEMYNQTSTSNEIWVYFYIHVSLWLFCYIILWYTIKYPYFIQFQKATDNNTQIINLKRGKKS